MVEVLGTSEHGLLQSPEGLWEHRSKSAKSKLVTEAFWVHLARVSNPGTLGGLGSPGQHPPNGRTSDALPIWCETCYLHLSLQGDARDKSPHQTQSRSFLHFLGQRECMGGWLSAFLSSPKFPNIKNQKGKSRRGLSMLPQPPQSRIICIHLGTSSEVATQMPGGSRQVRGA